MSEFEWLSLAPYGMGRAEKQAFLTRELVALCRHHEERCPEYKRMIRSVGVDWGQVQGVADLPFLPVRLFKDFKLRSVPEGEVYKTMTSSGTTGQQVSRIYLDRETSAAQSKVLAKIAGDFIGRARMPMIILDTDALLKNRDSFSARGAGVLGFSVFARDKLFALNERMELDAEAIGAFLAKHEGEDLFLFGFTFIVWRHFIGELKRLGLKLDLSRAVLIHGGGWKKLTSQAVTARRFKEALAETCGLARVHDYYGMVEQTGTVYMECGFGRLHTPVWADVLIRRPADFSLADEGERGLIQVAGVLPRSYPGHILLTEDEGSVLGEDDCPCGRKGKYFAVFGRVEQAELRGCSDTYERV